MPRLRNIKEIENTIEESPIRALSHVEMDPLGAGPHPTAVVLRPPEGSSWSRIVAMATFRKAEAILRRADMKLEPMGQVLLVQQPLEEVIRRLGALGEFARGTVNLSPDEYMEMPPTNPPKLR